MHLRTLLWFNLFNHLEWLALNLSQQYITPESNCKVMRTKEMITFRKSY